MNGSDEAIDVIDVTNNFFKRNEEGKDSCVGPW